MTPPVKERGFVRRGAGPVKGRLRDETERLAAPAALVQLDGPRLAPEPPMPPIDYEAEYNNRARVPEHPANIAGWARDAQAYRDLNLPLRIAYGPSERQFIDLFHAGAPDRAAATVIFIHGGYWQNLAPSFFSHLARGPNAHGLDVAVAGYDLCPQVRVGDIVEELRAAAASSHASRGGSSSPATRQAGT